MGFGEEGNVSVTFQKDNVLVIIYWGIVFRVSGSQSMLTLELWLTVAMVNIHLSWQDILYANR